MPPMTVAVIIALPERGTPAVLSPALAENPRVKTILSLGGMAGSDRVHVIATAHPCSGAAISRAIVEAGQADFFLFLPQSAAVDLRPDELDDMLGVAAAGGQALYYADYYQGTRSADAVCRLIDCQCGSIRDDFDFGPCMLFSRACVQRALRECGPLSGSRWSGLYELRLKASCAGGVVRIDRPLGCVPIGTRSGPGHFQYLQADQRDCQIELERIATAHLQHINACCSHDLREPPPDTRSRPVAVSVVIPVRNREKTITDAIRSALSQQTDFSFNVIVVDNHSSDRTGALIAEVARQDPRVVHLVPRVRGLGIGGCWNEAIAAPVCGRFVCQLDSDDLYAGPETLARMTVGLRAGCCAMAVGAYRVVDFNLREIPPGLVDHREWTAENGRNNLLRVQGIGAPRAFCTSVLSANPFPDVSYGEDYAVALCITRDYAVERIYEPVYLCRRWAGNSDAGLSREQANAHDAYKDGLRSREIAQRQALAAGRPTGPVPS